MTGQKRSKTARLSGNKGVKNLVFKVVGMSSNQGQVVNSLEVRQPGCREVKQSSSQIVRLSGSKKSSCQILPLSGSKKSSRQPDCQETG
jgi:hypothetical protein